jgi:hypothetical protein
VGAKFLARLAKASGTRSRIVSTPSIGKLFRKFCLANIAGAAAGLE